jgi:maltose alpha-D-glucosyltransferase/alpha-amylase
MAFHFPLMPRMYMAIAQEDRHPLVEIMQQTPDIPESAQWAIFLRNHDELTLEMVTSRERDYMYKMYAADAQARINLGIRRRLAPLMENDPERIKLMNSLLLSMPGSPIIYYGDEIGMGDNIYLGDRNGVRTPMQWSPDRNAGFSRADPQRLYLPPIMDAIYGYEAVNVEAQSRDPASMLNWMKRMLAVRKTSQAFGRGKLTFLHPGNRKVLCYLRELGDDAILCVANLSRTAQPVELDLKRFKGRVPVELLGRTAFPPIGERFYLFTLPAYGHYWFRLAADALAPEWHAQVTPPQEQPMLVLFDSWMSFFRDKVVPWRIGMAEKLRENLEASVLPPFLESQRWYAQKGEAVARAAILDYTIWNVGAISWLLAWIEVKGTLYFLPMALAWEEDEDQVKALSVATVARVRQQANVGVLGDAIADVSFCRHVIKAIGEGRSLPTQGGTLKFTPTGAFAEIAKDELATLHAGRLGTQSTNTSVMLGDRLFLKVYRRVRPGVNPELEIGRFLTETARFPHCVPLAGAVEYSAAGAEPAAVALLQAFVPNQGDGWGYTLAYLERTLAGPAAPAAAATATATAAAAAAAAQAPPGTAPAPAGNVHGAYLALIETLGTRTAELHRALATKSGNPDFEPEPLVAQDVLEWKKRVREEAVATFARLQRTDVDKVLQAVDACAAPAQPVFKIRHHGDYHLGQVLLANNDFLIIDFEGEPSRPLAESRRKRSPLRDVAGMLRSFSYARGAALSRAPAEPPAERERLGPALEAWERDTRKAFVDAYAEAMEGSGLFASFDDVRGLARLAEIEKVLYELRYELDNRPAWVHIPLQGLAYLVDKPEGG